MCDAGLAGAGVSTRWASPRFYSQTCENATEMMGFLKKHYKNVMFFTKNLCLVGVSTVFLTNPRAPSLSRVSTKWARLCFYYRLGVSTKRGSGLACVCTV